MFGETCYRCVVDRHTSKTAKGSKLTPKSRSSNMSEGTQAKNVTERQSLADLERCIRSDQIGLTTPTQPCITRTHTTHATDAQGLTSGRPLVGSCATDVHDLTNAHLLASNTRSALRSVASLVPVMPAS